MGVSRKSPERSGLFSCAQFPLSGPSKMAVFRWPVGRLHNLRRPLKKAVRKDIEPSQNHTKRCGTIPNHTKPYRLPSFADWRTAVYRTVRDRHRECFCHQYVGRRKKFAKFGRNPADTTRARCNAALRSTSRLSCRTKTKRNVYSLIFNPICCIPRRRGFLYSLQLGAPPHHTGRR